MPPKHDMSDCSGRGLDQINHLRHELAQLTGRSTGLSAWEAPPLYSEKGGLDCEPCCDPCCC
jgi:hypothetical protein